MHGAWLEPGWDAWRMAVEPGWERVAERPEPAPRVCSGCGTWLWSRGGDDSRSGPTRASNQGLLRVPRHVFSGGGGEPAAVHGAWIIFNMGAWSTGMGAHVTSPRYRIHRSIYP